MVFSNVVTPYNAEHRAALEAAGWRVAVIWECEAKQPEGLRARLAELFGLPGSA